MSKFIALGYAIFSFIVLAVTLINFEKLSLPTILTIFGVFIPTGVFAMLYFEKKLKGYATFLGMRF